MINLYFKNFNFNLSNSIGTLLFSEYEKDIFIKRVNESATDYKIYSFSDFKSRINWDGRITSPLDFPMKGVKRVLAHRIVILEDITIKSISDAVLFNAVCDFIINNEIVFCIKIKSGFGIDNIFTSHLNCLKNSPESLILDIYKQRLKLICATRIIIRPDCGGYTSSMANIIHKINSLGFIVDENSSMASTNSEIIFFDKNRFKIRLGIIPLKGIEYSEYENISKNEISINTSLTGIYFYPEELIKKIKIFFITARNIRKSINCYNSGLKIANNVNGGMSEIQNISLQELVYSHLVIAGAGSGKTRIIVNKFLYLLNFIPYDSILVLTFTNNAADEIKNRIFSGLRINGGVKNNLNNDKILNISTYHSFFYSIIKEFYKELGFECIPKVKEQSSLPCQNEKDISISYDEIVTNVIKLFKNDAIVHEIASRFKYILIDEYQDLDFLSDYIIKKLDYARGVVMYAGDDDQAIYGFNGGDAFNILFFDLFFPSGKVFVLQNNYRSNYGIIEFCNSILNNIAFRYPKKLTAKRAGSMLALQAEHTPVQEKTTNPVNIFSFKNKYSEEEFIKEMFNKFISIGKSAAILTRTQKESEHFKTILGRPYADDFSGNAGNAFLGTIHRSKGLEFDIVFIANVTQGNIPHLKSMPPVQSPNTLNHPFIEFLDKNIKLKPGIVDEAKLFYVAVSRAKEKVFITYSGKISEFLKHSQNKTNIMEII